MTTEAAQKIKEVYEKAIARLRELFKLEKEIITKYQKEAEKDKIEELRNKIQNQNNG